MKKRDFSEDAVVLAKAAKIIRNDIFDSQCFKFVGSFPPKCQEDSLPSSLKTLVSLILNGFNLKDQEKLESQACLTIGQLIFFNIKKRPTDSSLKPRHNLVREPPLPIYAGLNIHQHTRSKKLIQQLYRMGVCISYDRIMEIEDWIATSTCTRFAEDGVVSPACLRKGLFTLGALDNLDHDPSSTTSQSSFHGTGISLFQFPSRTNPGEGRPPVTIPPQSPGTKQHYLPHSYSFVPAVTLSTARVSVPKLNNSTNPTAGGLPSSEHPTAPHSHDIASATTDDSVPILDNESDVGPILTCLGEAEAKEISWIEHMHLVLLTRKNLSGKMQLHGLLIMPRNKLLQKILLLCVHYCLCSTRRRLLQQWSSMAWMSRNKLLSTSTLDKYQSLLLTSHYLLWLSMYSGSGQTLTVSQCMLSC